jgi:hypothetical protein
MNDKFLDGFKNDCDRFKILNFRSRETFAKRYGQIEAKSFLRNFKGEPFNWAAFCKFEKDGFIYCAKPKSDRLQIVIECVGIVGDEVTA